MKRTTPPTTALPVLPALLLVLGCAGASSGMPPATTSPVAPPESPCVPQLALDQVARATDGEVLATEFYVSDGQSSFALLVGTRARRQVMFTSYEDGSVEMPSLRVSLVMGTCSAGVWTSSPERFVEEVPLSSAYSPDAPSPESADFEPSLANSLLTVVPLFGDASLAAQVTTKDSVRGTDEYDFERRTVRWFVLRDDEVNLAGRCRSRVVYWSNDYPPFEAAELSDMELVVGSVPRVRGVRRDGIADFGEDGSLVWNETDRTVELDAPLVTTPTARNDDEVMDSCQPPPS